MQPDQEVRHLAVNSRPFFPLLFHAKKRGNLSDDNFCRSISVSIRGWGGRGVNLDGSVILDRALDPSLPDTSEYSNTEIIRARIIFLQRINGNYDRMPNCFCPILQNFVVEATRLDGKAAKVLSQPHGADNGSGVNIPLLTLVLRSGNLRQMLLPIG